MLKAYKYRLYPTLEQEEYLNKVFGINRYLWNSALDYKKTLWQHYKINLKGSEIVKEFRLLAKEEQFAFIKEAPSITFDNTIKNFETAFKNFFTRVKKGDKPGYPKFKSKKGPQSFQMHQGCKIDFDAASLDIPKCKGIKMVVDHPAVGTQKTVTISKTPTGKYFSVCWQIMAWSYLQSCLSKRSTLLV